MRLALLQPNALTTSQWIKSDEARHNYALDRLYEVGIVERDRADASRVRISSAFATCMSRAILNTPAQAPDDADDTAVELDNGGPTRAAQPEQEAAQQPSDDSELDGYAEQCWDRLIGLLANAELPLPSKPVVQLLLDAGLLQRDGRSSKISTDGFQFLLLDRASQLWLLLLAFLETAFRADKPRRELLSFLFALARRPPGAVLPDGDGEALRPVLRGLGLLRGDVATGAARRLVTGGGGARRHGHLIVETNFRVYAYTSSPLDVAILRLFSRPSVRLPNLVVGAITRESVRTALVAGITARQILAYARQHAHSSVTGPPVPLAVAEQITLWASERERVQCRAAALFTLPAAALYRAAVAEARRHGVLLFANDAELQVVVDKVAGTRVLRQFFLTQQ